MTHYMVDIDLPSSRSVEFLSLIPTQRAHINKLLGEGTVVSYSLSLDRCRLWVILVAQSADEATAIVSRFPLALFFRTTIHPLVFHDGLTLSMTKVSLN